MIPIIMFIIVVLPAPLCPSRTVISLLLIVMFKLSEIIVSRFPVLNFLHNSVIMIAWAPRGAVVYSLRCRFWYVLGWKYENEALFL